jgi:hypothetical protein
MNELSLSVLNRVAEHSVVGISSAMTGHGVSGDNQLRRVPAVIRIKANNPMSDDFQVLALGWFYSFAKCFLTKSIVCLV